MASKLNFTFRLGVPKVRLMYIAITNDIQVTALPDFLMERSDPAQDRYFWSYTIEIANLGRVRVQLLSRHWVIIDANGRREEVSGPGVVGEQPVLEPGETFRYVSGCPLATPSGMMQGSYRMATDAGETFDIEVPAFSLDSPLSRPTLN
jgi:ApaG protein